MKFDFTRTKVGAAALAAFLGGLLVAAGFDLTPFSYAQQQAQLNTTAPVIPAAKSVADLGSSFAAIAEVVTPAVVSIRSESRAPERRPQPQQQQRPQNDRTQPPPGTVPPGLEEFLIPPQPEPSGASGTGFIVSADGYILTNNHVVTRNDRQTRHDRVTVTLNDGRRFDAKIVGNDWETDVAVIKIDARALPTVALGDDGQARIGEWVLAIGNPLGLDFTVTAGIVSAKGRNANLNADRYAISDFIQTDAAINPGNSGGPLINARGEVIGINSAIASRTGYYQGYGFAIPITLARDIMQNLIEYGRVRASVLGVSIQNVDPTDAEAAGLKTVSGVLVSAFTPDSTASPAARAGVELGDVITSLNSRPIDHVGTLQRTVRSYSPGTVVELGLNRYGKQMKIKVKLDERTPQPVVAQASAERPSESNGATYERLGINVEAVNSAWLREQNVAVAEGFSGLRITEVSPDRPDEAVLENVIITDVVHPQPRRAIKTEADLRAVLSRVKDGDIITLRVRPVEETGPQRELRLGQPAVVNLKVGSQR